MSCNCKPELAKNIEVEVLVATVFLLMTRYASHQEKQLVQPIVEHFDWINNHPDLVNPELKNTCSRLAKCWKFMEFGGALEAQEDIDKRCIH
ncbi:MAG: hypothetical protein CMH70_08495 [Nitrosomonadaceae bacterium]|nr:hypothetical protein [Nitrosomonadaceae bacterium]|tara:strand:+ start:1419 stop:1694 length:276 start_codon:yes stop_codon:yes gene_type:complete